jgi:hypothetical protein
MIIVSGLMICLSGAEVINTPLNGSVILVEGKPVILTNDYWKIVINVNLSVYEDVIANLRGDLSQIEGFSQSYSAVREMQKVENTLASLENKLRELKEILLRVDVRRGLINLGGRILKTLFGTATVMDIEGLQNTVSKLHDSEKAIVHSVNQHLTYIKKLDESVTFNAQAIANLSTMMKVVAIGLNSGMSKLVSEVEGLNNSLIMQREAFVVIRQLEFALTQRSRLMS